MPHLTSDQSFQSVDDFLLHIGTITRCDTPAQWVLSERGKEYFDRCYAYAYNLFQNKQFFQAQQLLIFLSFSNPIEFRIELAIGLCAKELGQFGEAIARFGKAMHLKIEDPRPIYFTAQIFELIEEWEKAWIFFDHAYKLALGDVAMSQILLHAKANRDACAKYCLS